MKFIRTIIIQNENAKSNLFISRKDLNINFKAPIAETR